LGYRYVVLGAGRQGVAAAYDLSRHGEAQEILLLDSDPDAASRACEKIDRLAGLPVARPLSFDASDTSALTRALAGAHAALSALPFPLNPPAARAAIEAGCCFNDLGGNTAVVQEELSLHEEALRKGVSIVPDCGLAPGLANLIAVAGMERLERPRSVHIWCGGLPKTPLPPLGYKLVFNIAGLTNEYTGEAVVLREGRVARLPALSGEEMVEFAPPVGRCEAFLTSGGTSTCPWTFEGRLESFEYRTVRYPGHLAKIRALAELGFFQRGAVDVSGMKVSPREVTHALLSARLDFPGEPDLVVLRVRVAGQERDRSMAIVIDLMEHPDPATGFSAMERCTAFPAAAVTWLQARGEVPPGARPQEISVPAGRLVEESRRRGLTLKETLEPGKR